MWIWRLTSSNVSFLQPSVPKTWQFRFSLKKTFSLRNSAKVASYKQNFKKLLRFVTKDSSMVRYVQNSRTTSTYLPSSTVPYQRTVLQFNFWSVPYPHHYKKGVPYPYHYKKGVPYQSTVLLRKIEAYRTVLPSLFVTLNKYVFVSVVFKTK